ncbi:TonB-dependent receptor plug domain-containing protein [Sphingomonas alpina]|uniref:TonB-dependent receptor n=1 Tax=Sphingomonas alpina TaxID=653931 RepID=A0A7H0LM77_9SPHN|nr:TonB-dependent receptor [Sphingomonas alpina]QNQ10780.1 TonB-dependent receptor [Sphingomonas alpina]
MKIERILCCATSAIALMYSSGALAQATTAPQTADTPAEQAGIEPAGAEAGDDGREIIVTGSRIRRDGFDQPTPTTVLGDVELRQGARANIQQVLNDQPQFRATVTPQVSNGNTSTGTAPVDLRGLGINRTLTLVNGRRFVGDNNLNFVPTGLIEQVQVVTGGASAAWGSGAVAGVVNLILKDDLQGVTVGAQSGISSRGDGMRYGFDASFGTKFAGGNGHFMIGGEYLKDEGIFDRNSRRNLGSAGIVRVNPTSLTDLSTRLTRDVNYGNISRDGLITTGVLAGQNFGSDGVLRPFRGGTPLGAGAFPGQMIGGADGVGLYDDVSASTPFDRLNIYGRASYDLGGATIWVDGTYGRSTSNARFLTDFIVPPLTISATNPFLSAAVRNQLAAAGETSFTLGRMFSDVLSMRFNTKRENWEGAFGINGDLGKFKYRAHYSHGEIHENERLENSRIDANFTNALDAVSSGGKIVCAINADAITTNDDPACRPLNPFGRYNASAEAVDYVTGTQQQLTTTKLDSVAAEIQGDLFSLWAGPVTLVVGGEARWSSISSTRNADAVAGIFSLPVYTSDLKGSFNVKEAFTEVSFPVIDAEGVAKVELNGAARYSDYSNSGGIWSWKAGGTARLFNDLLLRVTRSRDIRSPDINELFSVRNINVGALVDQDSAGRVAIPGYNATPQAVTTYSGGNPDLVPEVSKGWTAGITYSPSFFRGFSLAVDYYDVNINGAITTLTASSLTLACSKGNTAACNSIIRNPTTQTVETVFSNSQNIASFSTRGVDIEASYVLPLSRVSSSMGGTLRMRALATYIDSFIFDTGVTRVDSAGSVGDATANGVPKWRGTLGLTYQDNIVGFDARVRYVDGGLYNRALTTLVNNKIASRTYLDLGAQFKVMDRFTLFGNVNNVFDAPPPITTAGNPHYDIVGTYFTAGVRVKF